MTEKELKEKVIEEDKNYQLKKIKRETEIISKILNINEFIAENILFQQVKEKIEKGEFVELKTEKTLPEIENYRFLTDYAGFIALQKDHFNLHTSIREIKLTFTGATLKINLFTDKERKILKEWKVKERSKKETSVFERLVGENCYILNEMEGIKERLKKFLKRIKIILYKLYTEEILGAKEVIL